MICNFIQAPRLNVLFNGGNFRLGNNVQSVKLILSHEEVDIDDTDFVDIGDTYNGTYLSIAADGSFTVDLEQLYTDYPEAGCTVLPLKVYECYGDSAVASNCTYSVKSIIPMKNIKDISVVYDEPLGQPTLVFDWIEKLGAFSSEWSINVELINLTTDTTLNSAELELDGSDWSTPTIISETTGTWLAGTLETDISGTVGEDMELNLDDETLPFADYRLRFSLNYCETTTSWMSYDFTVTDTVAPLVQSTIPADASDTIAVDTTVTVVFSEQMKDGTENDMNLYAIGAPNTLISGTWSTADDITYVFTPDSDLASGTTHSIINQVALYDLYDNELAAGTIVTFETA